MLFLYDIFTLQCVCLQFTVSHILPYDTGLACACLTACFSAVAVDLRSVQACSLKSHTYSLITQVSRARASLPASQLLLFDLLGGEMGLGGGRSGTGAGASAAASEQQVL
jgi:hypothetical protein